MNFFIPIEIKNRDYLSRLLIAYHAAVAKNTDVDQPRNLAKSVTVE